MLEIFDLFERLDSKMLSKVKSFLKLELPLTCFGVLNGPMLLDPLIAKFPVRVLVDA